MNRAARRQAKRAREANGVGLGWRRTSRGRRYLVREHSRRVSIEQLEAESDAAIEKWGIGRDRV